MLLFLNIYNRFSELLLINKINFLSTTDILSVPKCTKVSGNWCIQVKLIRILIPRSIPFVSRIIIYDLIITSLASGRTYSSHSHDVGIILIARKTCLVPLTSNSNTDQINIEKQNQSFDKSSKYKSWNLTLFLINLFYDNAFLRSSSSLTSASSSSQIKDFCFWKICYYRIWSEIIQCSKLISKKDNLSNNT